MIEFIAGMGVAALFGKKVKNRSQEEIKETINSGIDTTIKILGASSEIAVERINSLFANAVPEGKETTETKEVKVEIVDTDIKQEESKKESSSVIDKMFND